MTKTRTNARDKNAPCSMPLSAACVGMREIQYLAAANSEEPQESHNLALLAITPGVDGWTTYDFENGYTYRHVTGKGSFYPVLSDGRRDYETIDAAQ